MMTKTIKVEGPVHVVCHCDKCKAQPQRTWVGLTDEEANQLWESTDSDWELMKRTEAKLKQKNGYAEEKNT